MDQGRQFEPEVDQQIKGSISRGPVEERSCKDICCLIFFILLTIFVIATGVYFITKADFSHLKNLTFNTSKSSSRNSQLTTHNQKEIKFEDIQKCLVYVLGMSGLAVILGIVYVILISKFTECMVYAMIAITTIMLLAMAILLFVMGAPVGGIMVSLIFLVWICGVWCWREKLAIGIKVLKVAGEFLTSRPSVFLVPILATILGALFLVFWVYSFMAISVSYPEEKENSIRTVLMSFWALLSTFYLYFIYYVMVFMIGTAAALWYYGREDSFWVKGIKWIVSAHIGSLTFASLIITIITFARQEAEKASRKNNPCALCFCILACCIKIIEQLVKVLNHNAVIVMSITGQDYIDSAKTTIGLIWQDLSLFAIVQFIGGIVYFGGILFVVSIPTFVGYLIMTKTMESTNDIEAIAFGVVAILVIALIISIIVISVISEALSSVFILFCLDKKYKALQPAVSNQAPRDIHRLFGDMLLVNNELNPLLNNYQGNQPNYNQPNYNQPNYNQPNYNQPNQNLDQRFNPSGQYDQYNRYSNPYQNNYDRR